MSLSVDNSNLLYPKKFHGQIKYTALYLNKDKNSITYEDVDKFKKYLEYAINEENLSPNQIQQSLNFNNEYFARTILNMGLKLKSRKDAVINYVLQVGNARTDEKDIYWRDCSFRFNFGQYSQILGYDLLFSHKPYHSSNNPAGLQRDHMISIAYGWENKIDPAIISHPANCEYLLAEDNIKKRESCSISLEILLERIKNWENITFDNTSILEKLPNQKRILKDIQKQEISNFQKTQITYTDGKRNIRQNKNLPIPEGFRHGITKFKKRILSDDQKKKLAITSSLLRTYTNGTTNIKQNKDLPAPLGFWPGMIKKKK